MVLDAMPVANSSEVPLAEPAGVSATNDSVSYRDGITSARKELLIKALGKTDGNRAAAARLLGLETKYFLKLMKSLGIE